MGLTQIELEQRLLYCVVVAGKSAIVADQSTDRLYKLLGGPTPLQYLAKGPTIRTPEPFRNWP